MGLPKETQVVIITSAAGCEHCCILIYVESSVVVIPLQLVVTIDAC